MFRAELRRHNIAMQQDFNRELEVSAEVDQNKFWKDNTDNIIILYNSFEWTDISNPISMSITRLRWVINI